MKEIQLSKCGTKNKGKYVALVDDEDFEYLDKFNWTALKVRHLIYAKSNFNGKPKLLHTFITGFNICDHIDGDGLNNQRYNLRSCTQQENTMNRKPRKNTSSKFKGVCWNKRCNKWHAYIKLNDKETHLGYFTDEIEAAKAYDAKAKELFVEFAFLNFNR